MSDNTEVYKALLAAQKEMGAVVKGKTNPFHKSAYVDIHGVLSHVLPVLHKHGLVLSQVLGFLDDQDVQPCLITEIVHAESGQAIESVHPLPMNDDAQKFGAWQTYARRYSLIALLGLPCEDDDGNSNMSSGRQTATRAKARTANRKPPPKENINAVFLRRTEGMDRDSRVNLIMDAIDRRPSASHPLTEEDMHAVLAHMDKR